jgi:molecular chaperone HscB
MKRRNVDAVNHLQYKSNYFTILAQDVEYNIDLKNLEDAYFEEQKKLNKLEQNKDVIASLSNLNNAYQTLSDDYSRAVYILSLNGIDLLSELDNRDIIPKYFLADILELNQEIEAMNDNVDMIKFMRNIEILRSKIIKDLEENFTHSDFNNFMINTQKLKYFDNILKKIREKIENAY